MNIENNEVNDYSFLKTMFEDEYYPNDEIEKGKKILIELCKTIESEKPQTIEQLYKLTQEATNQFNKLEDNNELEIETVARECIARDFKFIAKAYGFDADVEELIATRNW